MAEVCALGVLSRYSCFLLLFQLDTRLNQLDMFKKLKKENQDFWVNFVKKYFCGPPYVCVSVVVIIDFNINTQMPEISNLRINIS